MLSQVGYWFLQVASSGDAAPLVFTTARAVLILPKKMAGWKISGEEELYMIDEEQLAEMTCSSRVQAQSSRRVQAQPSPQW